MLKHIISISLIYILGLSSVFAQDLEPLFKDFHDGKRDKVIAALDTLIYKYPNAPSVKYLRGLVQDNALMSTGIFKDIMRKFPNTKYAKLSQLHVAEYYYSQGLYRQSRQLFKECLSFNLNDFDAKRAGNQCLRAGIASRLIDSSKVDLRYMTQKYPNVQFDIPKELESVVLERAVTKPSSLSTHKTGLRPLGKAQTGHDITSDSGKYGLQIAAFSTLESANEIVKNIEAIHRRGEVRTKVVNGKTLYVVVVGRYATRNDAISDKNNINRKLNTSSFIIKFE